MSKFGVVLCLASPMSAPLATFDLLSAYFSNITRDGSSVNDPIWFHYPNWKLSLAGEILNASFSLSCLSSTAQLCI